MWIAFLKETVPCQLVLSGFGPLLSLIQARPPSCDLNISLYSVRFVRFLAVEHQMDDTVDIFSQPGLIYLEYSDGVYYFKHVTRPGDNFQLPSFDQVSRF